MKSFKIGENVGFLHEKGSAEIVEIISNQWVIIKDSEGFVQKRNTNDLIKIHGNDYQLQDISLPKDVTKITRKKITTELGASTNKKQTTWEIDLHIEHLLDSFKGLSNTEILLKQMHHFRSKFSTAKNQRIQKLIVIHGVGEGVLKNEIRTFLHRQEHIEFFDGSYLEYGKGATEIRFNYK